MSTTRGTLDLRVVSKRYSQSDWNSQLLAYKNDPANLLEHLKNRFANFRDQAFAYVARARAVTLPDATSTFTTTFGSITVGDKIDFYFPGLVSPVTITAVANSADVGSNGTYAANGSNANMVASIVRAIKGNPRFTNLMTASGSATTVTLTSLIPGSLGNSIFYRKTVTTANVFSFSNNGTFTGGKSLPTSEAVTWTFGSTATNAKIYRFGNVVLTAKTSGASGENEFNIGASATASATNLKTAINAHSILAGLMVATDDGAGVCTCTVTDPDLLTYLLYLNTDDSSCTLSGQFTTTGVTYTTTGLPAAGGVF